MKIIMDSEENSVELTETASGVHASDVMDTLVLGAVGMITQVAKKTSTDPAVLTESFIENMRRGMDLALVVDDAEFDAAIEDLCKGAVNRDD
ncbi:hypothetical protein [Corynebacterium glyciniphilum]|uniref:hypothetical protein n=1 Tax=Corynebacterium glyciniphilum TaxID=1404244 RepID=UPI003FD51A4D